MDDSGIGNFQERVVSSHNVGSCSGCGDNVGSTSGSVINRVFSGSGASVHASEGIDAIHHDFGSGNGNGPTPGYGGIGRGTACNDIATRCSGCVVGGTGLSNTFAVVLNGRASGSLAVINLSLNITGIGTKIVHAADYRGISTGSFNARDIDNSSGLDRYTPGAGNIKTVRIGGINRDCSCADIQIFGVAQHACPFLVVGCSLSGAGKPIDAAGHLHAGWSTYGVGGFSSS